MSNVVVACDLSGKMTISVEGIQRLSAWKIHPWIHTAPNLLYNLTVAEGEGGGGNTSLGGGGYVPV
jgi:hypothetical protein